MLNICIVLHALHDTSFDTTLLNEMTFIFFSNTIIHVNKILWIQSNLSQPATRRANNFDWFIKYNVIESNVA